MRNSYKIILASILVIILACSLFACNPGHTTRPYEPAPEIPGTTPDGSGGDIDAPSYNPGEAVYLSPVYKNEYMAVSPSYSAKGSILPTIYAENEQLKDLAFRYEMVSFQVIGKIGKNQYKPMKFKFANDDEPMLSADLKEAYISTEDDKALLKSPGKHHVNFHISSLLVEDKDHNFIQSSELKGSVEIYLGKYMNDIKTTAQFDLTECSRDDASQIVQDETNIGVGTAQLMIGESIAYADFISNYNVIPPKGKAVHYWKVFENNVEKTVAIENGTRSFKFGLGDDIVITIEKGISYKFVPVTTADTVEVKIYDKFNGSIIKTESIPKKVGRVTRPTIEPEPGKTLVGWFFKDGKDDILWNFNETIGYRTSLDLYPIFENATFSLTMYLRGSLFAPPQQGTPELNKLETAKAYASFQKYDPYGMNILKIDGLEYGKKYSDYKIHTFYSYEEIEGKDPVTGAITYDKHYEAAEIDLANLTKYMNKKITVDTVTYDFYQEPKLKADDIDWMPTSLIKGDKIIYAEWNLKSESEGFKAKDYDKYVFKNNVTIKADGTLRLDKIEDYYIEELSIPDKYEVNGKSYDVTEIGPLICQNFTGLRKLDLSRATNLTIIGDRAFANCISLQIGVNNAKLETIGQDAFEGTKLINEAEGNVIVDNILVKYKGNNVVEINNSTIANEADKIFTISAGAFANNPDITSVTLNGVKVINDRAFDNCVNLKTVNITGAKYIAPTAFNKTPFMVNFEKKYADDLKNNNNIATGTIKFGDYLYVVKTTEETYNLTGDIKIIGENAFLNNTKLKNITFENDANITDVYKDAFKGTLFVITNKEGKTTYIKNGFVVVNNILCAYTGTESAVAIPKGIKAIAPYAFSGYNNENVIDILVPPSVEKIGAYAFDDAFSKAYSDRGDARIMFYQKGHNNAAFNDGQIDIHPTAFATDYIEYIADDSKTTEGKAGKNVNLIPVVRKGAMPKFLKFCYLTNVLYTMAGDPLTITENEAFKNDETSFIGKLYHREKDRFVSCQMSNIAFNEDVVENEYLLSGPVSNYMDLIKKSIDKVNNNAITDQVELFNGIVETYVLTKVVGNKVVVDSNDSGMKINTGLLFKDPTGKGHVKFEVYPAEGQPTQLKYTLNNNETEHVATLPLIFQNMIALDPDIKPADGIIVVDATKAPDKGSIQLNIGDPKCPFNEAIPGENGSLPYIFEGRDLKGLKLKFRYATDPDAQNPIIWPSEGELPSDMVKAFSSVIGGDGNYKNTLILEYKVSSKLTYRIEFNYAIKEKEYLENILVEKTKYPEDIYIPDNGQFANEPVIKLPINSAINEIDTKYFNIQINDGTTINPSSFRGAEFRISSITSYTHEVGGLPENIIKDLRNPVLTELGSGTVNATYILKNNPLNVKFNFEVVMRPDYKAFDYKFERCGKQAPYEYVAHITKINKYNQETMMIPGVVCANDLGINLDLYKPTDYTGDFSKQEFKVIGIDIPTNSLKENNIVKEIGMPSSIQTISPKAFSGWKNLNRIGYYDLGTAPKYVKELNKDDFGVNNTAKNEFPTGLKSIGAQAFSNTNLTDIVIKATGLTQIGNGAFMNTPIVNVDLTECTAISDIGTQAFGNCYELKTVKLPNNSGAIIETQAFLNCYKLYSVENYAAWDKSIGAFTSCKVLVGDGTNAFIDCHNAKVLNIKDTTNVIGFSPELGADIEYLYIGGSGVTTIKANAFKDCKKLKYVFISSDITTIESGAFSGCDGLVEIVVGDSVNTIQANAFLNCKELTKVTYLGTKPGNIDTNAYAGCIKYKPE